MTVITFDGTTHISVVLDRSGSMAELAGDTIGGFNTWLRTTKAAARGLRDTRLTLHLFDDRHEYPYLDTPLREVKKLTSDVYWARGATALRDAFGAEIMRLDQVVGENDRALVLVITDGYENASCEVTHEQLRRSIRKHEMLPNWTFQYIGANQDAFAVGHDMGMRANMVSARADADGVASTFRAMGANHAEFLSEGCLAAAPLTQADYDAALAHQS